ncbi:MAG TPA: alpha/beta hydrolase [Methylocella sp.]|nr:alpha/beta hydrolase [Methylocella sp.]
MELFPLAENPLPEGGIVSVVSTRDRLHLRAAHWLAGTGCAGTVAIFPGHTEFIEKYSEVIHELLSRNFDVAILDWRGQGASSRLAKNPRKGHVGNFRAFGEDIRAFTEQVLQPFCRPPWFALGHSMGGAILLEMAHAGRLPFARLVLSAPMIRLQGMRIAGAKRLAVKALTLLGQGRRFVPGGGGPDPSLQFAGNILTSDAARHGRCVRILEALPELTISGPTIGWVNAAFHLMRRFEDPAYARRITIPTLIVAPGNDRLVDAVATEDFASRLKAGKCITLPGARHEILMERDIYRQRFWAAFDAFLPGESGADLGPRDARGFAAAKLTPSQRSQLTEPPFAQGISEIRGSRLGDFDM